MPDTTTPTLPPATERSSFTSWAYEKLRLGDTDRQGHVNNAVFATFAETGRIDFRGELHWPGKVDIGTRLLAVGRTSWRLEHGIFSGDRCVATAVSVMVTI